MLAILWSRGPISLQRERAFLATRASLLSMRASDNFVWAENCCTINPDCLLRLLWSQILTDSAAFPSTTPLHYNNNNNNNKEDF